MTAARHEERRFRHIDIDADENADHVLGNKAGTAAEPRCSQCNGLVASAQVSGFTPSRLQ